MAYISETRKNEILTW